MWHFEQKNVPKQPRTFCHIGLVQERRNVIATALELRLSCINTLRPRQNGRHFTDDVFKCIFLNENVRILLKIPLKFVPKGPINNIPSLVQVMAWRRPGDKPLSEPMMVSLTTHICVTRPQWVNPLTCQLAAMQLNRHCQYQPSMFWSINIYACLSK